MNVQISWLDFQTILPEIILVGFALVGLLYGAFYRKTSASVVPYISIVGIGLAIMVNFQQVESTTAFYNMVVADKISEVLNFIFLLTAFLTVLLSLSYKEHVKFEFVEFFPLILLSTTGMMLMGKANHFMIFFLGLETMSIALYVLAG